MSFIKKIITNNTGFSVKNLAVFSGIVIAVFAVFAFIVLVFLDFFLESQLSINLTHLAILVGAIEGIIAVLMGLKVWSEKYEKHH